MSHVIGAHSRHKVNQAAYTTQDISRFAQDIMLLHGASQSGKAAWLLHSPSGSRPCYWGSRPTAAWVLRARDACRCSHTMRSQKRRLCPM